MWWGGQPTGLSRVGVLDPSVVVAPDDWAIGSFIRVFAQDSVAGQEPVRSRVARARGGATAGPTPYTLSNQLHFHLPPRPVPSCAAARLCVLGWMRRVDSAQWAGVVTEMWGVLCLTGVLPTQTGFDPVGSRHSRCNVSTGNTQYAV